MSLHSHYYFKLNSFVSSQVKPFICRKKDFIVIYKFYNETKIPSLLNTSFNLHGEPIVNDINDALHVFENSELDALWLNDHIIEK